MKKFLAVTAAAVALMASAPLALAQMQQEGNWYVIDGSGGSKLVVGEANPEGSPLLMGENGAKPSDCATGSFYDAGNNMIASCDDDTAMFDMRAPDAGETMTNTEPYPENAMLLVPHETGDSKSDQDTDTSTN